MRLVFCESKLIFINSSYYVPDTSPKFSFKSTLPHGSTPEPVLSTSSHLQACYLCLSPTLQGPPPLFCPYNLFPEPMQPIWLTSTNSVTF